MPEYILLQPLAVAQLMMTPGYCLVTPDYIAVMADGRILVIPGDFKEVDDVEVNRKIVEACENIESKL